MPAPAARVDRLCKNYRVHERPPGLTAALRSVFHRSYKDLQAVRELSFTIEPGERVGFLGPNGAGKTTTLKMLAGLLHPTSGEVTVAGFVPFQREASFLRRITLVMGQKQQLLWDLPPADTFAMNGALYGIPDRELRATLDELDSLLEIGEVARKPTRQLSLGERMKCELAALVRTQKSDKRIALKLSAPIPREVLERAGSIVEHDPLRVVLQVSQARLREVTGLLLDQESVSDLTIEDPPLEEVMRALFASSEESKESKAHGDGEESAP